jgi:hypothetical protein
MCCVVCCHRRKHVLVNVQLLAVVLVSLNLSWAGVASTCSGRACLSAGQGGGMIPQARSRLGMQETLSTQVPKRRGDAFLESDL